MQRGLCPLFRDEPSPMVQGLLRRHPLLHIGRPPRALVLRLCAPHFCWGLLRIQVVLDYEDMFRWEMVATVWSRAGRGLWSTQ